jgi:hypothetical protein
MLIYVVGCNHGIQVEPGDLWAASDSSEQQEQRNHFAGLLEDIIKEKKIEFIGEEAGRVGETSAGRLANKYKIPATNINTTNADKEKMGIPKGYPTGLYRNEQKEQWHRKREQFMLQRIRKHRGEAKNLLIICGFEHLDRLSGFLQQDGEVQRIDYRKFGWYRAAFFGE